MTTSTQLAFISEAEYLAREEASLVKHEYYEGRIYAMAGATPSHALINSNIIVAIGSRLRGKRCRGTGSDQRVKIEAAQIYTYPDALIICPPERYAQNDPNSLTNPRVIIEVLSPSTERYDRTDKFDNYKQIASLTDYILVAQDRVRVEHYRRGEEDLWTQRSYNQREAVISLPEIDLELPLLEIYERLDDLPSGLFLLSDGEIK